jgi:hypothetical protein
VVAPDDVGVAELVGTGDRPAALADLPLPARGPHGRRFGLLRLLAVERGIRGLAMVIAGLAAFHVADERGSILSYLERLAVAAQPLGEQLGIAQFRAELRDATLPAGLLRSLDRSPVELTSHRVI